MKFSKFVELPLLALAFNPFLPNCEARPEPGLENMVKKWDLLGATNKLTSNFGHFNQVEDRDLDLFNNFRRKNHERGSHRLSKFTVPWSGAL